MTDRLAVLLTNDDGIDATGLREVHDELSRVADVTVVAPAANRSGISRRQSREFDVDRREFGYAVDGTPVDCVHFGRGGLDEEFDLVVSGCNAGPNVGAHHLTRSGTIAAALEASYLGVPGIALSLYCTPMGWRDFEARDFRHARTAATTLVEWVAENGAGTAFDYLHALVPADGDDPGWRITEPTVDFEVSVRETDDGYRAHDHFVDPLLPDVEDDVTDPPHETRRALVDEVIAVTPLRIGPGVGDVSALASLVDRTDDGD